MRMADKPKQSHSLASRCLCMKCGRAPAKIEAEGEGMLTIKAHCHGEVEIKTVEKKEMLFTQKFFGGPEDSESLSDDIHSY